MNRALDFDCPNPDCKAAPGAPCLDWERKPRAPHRKRQYLTWGGPDAPEAVALREKHRPKRPDVRWRPGDPADLNWRLNEDMHEIAAWLGGSSLASRIANGIRRLPDATTLEDVREFLNAGRSFQEVQGPGPWHHNLNLGAASEKLLRIYLGLPVEARCPTCGQKIRR